MTGTTLKTPYVQRVDTNALTEFCVRALIAAGLSEDDARLTSRLQVQAEMRGIYTHGLAGFRKFAQMMRDGGIDPRGVPEITAEGPAWAQLDAHAAVGMIGAHAGMSAAIGKAKQMGIGTAGVRNSTHFGAACVYAMMAMDEGMIGIAASNVNPVMTIPGARGAVLGNNPLAYAIPAKTQPSMVLDIAMSTVAGGKVFSAKVLGQSIPDTWLTDIDGLPTTDPSGFTLGSALTPFAGHKGYGIGLLIESLAGVLTGAGLTSDMIDWSQETDKPADQGHWFMAVNVEAMMPADAYYERVDKLIDRMRTAPKAKGVERTFVPGEMELEHEALCREHGIALTQATIDNLTGLAVDVGIEDALPWTD